jgi:hypothetical protein
LICILFGVYQSLLTQRAIFSKLAIIALERLISENILSVFLVIFDLILVFRFIVISNSSSPKFPPALALISKLVELPSFLAASLAWSASKNTVF